MGSNKRNEIWEFEDDGEPTRKSERPHPILKVPGMGKRPYWERKIGRWVDYRIPVPGIAIDLKTSDS